MLKNFLVQGALTARSRIKFAAFMAVIVLVSTPFVNAAGAAAGGDHSSFITTFLWMGVLLLAAKGASLIERFGQSAVLGELLMGLILGNFYLIGITIFEPIKSDAFIPFLAELGVVILLFQVGLESNIKKMAQKGTRALMVAIIGVVAPFVLGTFLVGPWLLPGLDFNTYLFLGAALTATSVGITARVFRDLGQSQSDEAGIIIGAAVIDDIMGLIVLAVVSAIVTEGSVSVASVAIIIAKAIGFLVGAIVIGQLTAKSIGKFFSWIHTGVGMKFTLAIVFALIFAAVAGLIGLAPIVGAFAAGLILDPVHFSYFKKPKSVEDLEMHAEEITDEQTKQRLKHIADEHSEKHIEDLIEPVANMFVPLFFVYTGMNVKLDTLFDPKILLVALGITAVAFVGKYVAGLVAGNVNKNIVGFGMVPRGEVGLIFATIGKGLGVLNDEVFSVIVVMVILTTLITPIILTTLIKRQALRQAAA